MKKINKYAVILCGGQASRAGLGFNKVLFVLGQKTVLETVLDYFTNFDKIIIAARKEDFDIIMPIASHYNAILTEGGKTRTGSVYNSLNKLNELKINDNDIVLIHDAARAFVTPQIIDKTIESAIEYGSGIAAVKIIDSIKEAQDGEIKNTLDREKLFAVQTPQTFRFQEIKAAYDKIASKEQSFEDDSEVYRLAGYRPKLTEGNIANKKLTNPWDFIPQNSNINKIGAGFDVHALTKNRKLVLGGIEIPHPLGLLGHSDADVLLHAITDSLLSAAGLADIGVLFPDNDNKFKDADSSILLKKACDLLKEKNLKIDYISAVIIAQKPKLSAYINDMRRRIAFITAIDYNKVNASATTTEFLGIIGKGEAIASSALCLCSQSDLNNKNE